MAEKDYDRALNEWHNELLLTIDLVNHVVDSLGDHDSLPGWLLSSARIASDRLQKHGETLPFQEVHHAR